MTPRCNRIVTLLALTWVASLPSASSSLPSSEELLSFAPTITTALERLDLNSSRRPVLHVIGAIDPVEGAVEWDCTKLSIVLVGAQLSRSLTKSCVTGVVGLYSLDLVAAAVSAEQAKPDVVLLSNSDIFACPWRRVLGELASVGIPVVATFYMHEEGIITERLLADAETAFSASQLATCDRITDSLYSAETTPRRLTEIEQPPAVTLLWETEANPRAPNHYGSRNAYWLAFQRRVDDHTHDHHDEL